MSNFHNAHLPHQWKLLHALSTSVGPILPSWEPMCCEGTPHAPAGSPIGFALYAPVCHQVSFVPWGKRLLVPSQALVGALCIVEESSVLRFGYSGALLAPLFATLVGAVGCSFSSEPPFVTPGSRPRGLGRDGNRRPCATENAPLGVPWAPGDTLGKHTELCL